MDLSVGFETYIEQVKANSPKNLKTVRYKERKLGREHGEIRFEWNCGRRGHAPHAHATGSPTSTARTGRVDRFAQPWIVQLLDEMHAEKSDGFAGVLTMVYAGDSPVAGHFGLRTATTLVGWFPAYDTEFARYSPGHHAPPAHGRARRGLRAAAGRHGQGRARIQELAEERRPVRRRGPCLASLPAAAVHWIGRTPVNKARTIVTDRPSLYRLADRVLKGFGRMRSPAQNQSDNPVVKEPWGVG